jgi:hypothetical protein
LDSQYLRNSANAVRTPAALALPSRDLAADRHFFYEEPPAGLDEPSDAFEDALGIRELRMM